jgi:hypothetical protein
MPERRLDRPPDVPFKTRPGGEIPLGHLHILVEQLGDCHAGLRLAPGHNLLEQPAELALRGDLDLAGLPELDLMALISVHDPVHEPVHASCPCVPPSSYCT